MKNVPLCESATMKTAKWKIRRQMQRKLIHWRRNDEKKAQANKQTQNKHASYFILIVTIVNWVSFVADCDVHWHR